MIIVLSFMLCRTILYVLGIHFYSLHYYYGSEKPLGSKVINTFNEMFLQDY